jgi:hypothetical protein
LVPSLALPVAIVPSTRQYSGTVAVAGTSAALVRTGATLRLWAAIPPA